MTEIVSFDDEQLILVDSNDKELGYETKIACHDGKGKLHRAFSILIFNSENELLIHQRSANKRLWGGYWTNSCCSHPRKGESMEVATQRRLDEELGLSCPLTFLYKFEYQATFGAAGSENEICWVFAGRCDDQPTFNSNEIKQIQWIDKASLKKRLEEQGETFTPWFKMEWSEIRKSHANTIENL